ncbi:hypothetical protein, partial [Mesorhizobium sp.]|uniref:hypothetical protein n=1 Tax=Mesorhizobium sp. TaxID=1871066 RepID=UPI0025EE6101
PAWQHLAIAPSAKTQGLIVIRICGIELGKLVNPGRSATRPLNGPAAASRLIEWASVNFSNTLSATVDGDEGIPSWLLIDDRSANI